MINYLIYKIFGRYIAKNRLKQFQTIVLRPMQWFIVFAILVIALEAIKYPEIWKIELFKQQLQNLIDDLVHGIFLYSFIKVILRFIDFVGLVLREKATLNESRADQQLVPFIKDALKLVVYIIFFFVLLGSIFGINISSLVAGVGIGGLAIAFAAQESIKDLFGSITIFLDSPFTVGDLVKVGEVEGTVETVGFRSTRIRTNDHSLVTMPNKRIMDTMIDNLTVRDYRRVRMLIGLKYETSMEQMKKIIEEIKIYLRSQQDLNAQSCIVVFDGFAESSLNILVIYFIPFTNGEEYLIRKSDLNFKIMEIVDSNDADFAFPVREIKISATDLKQINV